MWIRTEPGELLNLEHAHYLHIVECGAPKFSIEIVCHIGSDRFVMAVFPGNSEGKRLANDYIGCVGQAMQRAGKLCAVPMYSRHAENVLAARAATATATAAKK